MKPTFSDLLHPYSHPNIYVEGERERENDEERNYPTKPASSKELPALIFL
jgi:hypothetical protein